VFRVLGSHQHQRGTGQRTALSLFPAARSKGKPNNPTAVASLLGNSQPRFCGGACVLLYRYSRQPVSQCGAGAQRTHAWAQQTQHRGANSRRGRRGVQGEPSPCHTLRPHACDHEHPLPSTAKVVDGRHRERLLVTHAAEVALASAFEVALASKVSCCSY